MAYSPSFDATLYTDPLSHNLAKQLDNDPELKSFRDEFVIPPGPGLTLKAQTQDDDNKSNKVPGREDIYLCGNSLGLQTKRTKDYITAYLDTWARHGVHGHFREIPSSYTRPWIDIDEQTCAAMANIVGANPSEVAVMQTLTANLQLLLCSFYRPTKQRYRIMLEAKAFPSDHFAVQSQLAHHGYSAQQALVLIEPDRGDTHYFSTQQVIDQISRYAESTAVVLLPGIHFYTGQFLDIGTITAFAHSKGIVAGWDLAHAVGNVPLNLHDWQVDFAVWCTYKYLNAGPGCIAGLFVHEQHGHVAEPPCVSEDGQSSKHVLTGGLDAQQAYGFRHRLCGWWGSSKTSRFDMNNVFVPLEGAAGWQLSNPSILDSTSLLASLAVFQQTNMLELRRRSIKLTGYLEYLLLHWPCTGRRPYRLLTPTHVEQRGAQLSVKLDSGLLSGVLQHLQENGVSVDERKPDVIRVAPAPLYNSFLDVWQFVDILWSSLDKQRKHSSDE